MGRDRRRQDQHQNHYLNDVKVNTGEWLLITVVRDTAKGEIRAYLNGELKQTVGNLTFGKNTTLGSTNNNWLCFGMDYHAANQPYYLNGSISEVRMWNDVRTDDEIREYAEKTVIGNEAGLAHAWDFSSAAEGEVYNDRIFVDKVNSGRDVKAVGCKQNPNTKYTVKFDLGGGTVEDDDAVAPQTVYVYSQITEPTVIPTRGNASVFTGWYKDAVCTKKWDFENDTVTADTTIYAGYQYEYSSSGLSGLSGVSFDSKAEQLCSAKRLSAAPLTFEATVKLSKSSKGGIIAGNWMDAGYYNYDLAYVTFEVTENGQPRLNWQQERDVNVKANMDVTVPGVDLRQNEWVHVAMTFDADADTVYCYVNGELVYSAGGCTFIPVIPAQALKIGGDYRGTGGQVTNSDCNTRYFRGEIANVSIWSDVRSAEDIKADFDALKENGTVPSEGDTLLCSWNFEDSDASLFEDLTGNENDVADFVDRIEPNFAKGGYTMIALPDTQFLSQNYPDTWKMLTQWIADTSEKYNLQAVMSLGDMVNTTKAGQWANCVAATDILINNGVNFMPMMGNHDFDNGTLYPSGQSTSFNENYPYEYYSGTDYFFDSYLDDKLDQTCWIVEQGGREYLIFSFGYNPSDGAIEWAEEIIKENPDKNVILTAHSFMYWDDTLHENANDNDAPAHGGKYLWDALGAKYPNVVLAMGGHIGYLDLAHMTNKNGAGEDVTSILCDAQGIDLTYNLGMMMMLTFHEDSDDVDINWYSVKNGMLFRERNQFTISVPHVGEETVEPDETEPDETEPDETEPDENNEELDRIKGDIRSYTIAKILADQREKQKAAEEAKAEKEAKAAEEDYAAQFDDIEDGAWYTEAVRWAAENGIVNGCGDGKFGPEDPITREQMTAILHRYAGFKGYTDGTEQTSIPQYNYSSWAESGVIWADSIGIYSRIGIDTEDLTETANRAEAAAYLMCFCEEYIAE